MKYTLKEISEVISDGTHSSPKRTEVGIPVLSAQNINHGKISLQTNRYTSIEEYEKFIKRICINKGDVLLTIVGSIGRSAVVNELPPAVFQRSVAVIRPKKDIAHSSYINHLFGSRNFQSELKRNSNQSSQAGVYLGRLGGIIINLPSLDEQRRIAKILDEVEIIINKAKKSIKCIKEIEYSFFNYLFGDRVQNPNGFKEGRLKEYFKFRTGKLDSNAAVKGGRYPFFTCSKETYQIDNFAFDCKALLLAGNNATADYSVKYFTGKFNAYQRTYVININENYLTYEYSRFFMELMLGDLKRYSKGTNTKYLTLKILEQIKILLPPLEDQIRFSNFLKKSSITRSKMEYKLTILEKLSESLKVQLLRKN